MAAKSRHRSDSSSTERPPDLVILGAPRTKKTSNQLVRTGRRPGGRMRILPSQAWSNWVALAHIKRPGGPAWAVGTPPLDWPMNLRAHFYRDAERGDAVGYYQGLADLLEKRHVIENDALIRSWDGSRLLKDSGTPRVELWFDPAPGVATATALITRDVIGATMPRRGAYVEYAKRALRG